MGEPQSRLAPVSSLPPPCRSVGAVITFVNRSSALPAEPPFSLLFYIHSCFHARLALWFSPSSVQPLERIVLYFLSFVLRPQPPQPRLCPSTWLARGSPRVSESPRPAATCTPHSLLSFCNSNATGGVSQNSLFLISWDCIPLDFSFLWFIPES